MCEQRESCSADRRCIKPDQLESRPHPARHAWREAASWSVDPARLFTIGHSTRPLEEFLGLLQREGVSHLVDVRAFPTSERYPHFALASLEKNLPQQGIRYSH